MAHPAPRTQLCWYLQNMAWAWMSPSPPMPWAWMAVPVGAQSLLGFLMIGPPGSVQLRGEADLQLFCFFPTHLLSVGLLIRSQALSLRTPLVAFSWD